jgi:hypothetical protein
MDQMKIDITGRAPMQSTGSVFFPNGRRRRRERGK